MLGKGEGGGSEPRDSILIVTSSLTDPTFLGMQPRAFSSQHRAWHREVFRKVDHLTQ